MKSLFISALALLFFISCSPNNKKVGGALPISLMQTEVKPFSDTLKADTFKVMLEGVSPKDMQIIFSINNFDGKQIYHQIFKASELINNYKKTVDLEKEEQQLKFLKQEVSVFFEDENFLEPAVTPEENPDQYTPDKSFYAELKETQLMGFKYRLGSDSKVYIAWSFKDQKVKMYYKCC